DTDVAGSRPDDLVERILLDRMTQPPDGAPDREQREARTTRQAEYARRGGEREVDVRRIARERRAGPRELADEAQLRRTVKMLAQEGEQGSSARIAVRVQRMAEALDAESLPQPLAERRAERPRPAERRQQRLDARRAAAVLDPFDCGESAAGH